MKINIFIFVSEICVNFLWKGIYYGVYEIGFIEEERINEKQRNKNERRMFFNIK